MDAPEADIVVDAALVTALIAEQFPELTGDVRLVENGWDNALFRLGDELAVRMPRRRIAATLIEHEQRVLPVLAPLLPVPVPVPVRAGRPGPAFPWPFSVVPWIPGRQLATVPVGSRGPVAGRLAEFVHAIAVPAAADAPANPYRGVPLAERDDAVRARLAGGRVPRAAELAAVWDAALAAPSHAGPPLWVHGDLHPGNLLADDDGRLAAVIDFSDLTAGDPATDLATAWLSFDEGGRAAFRNRIMQLRPVDAAAWLRARGWAVAMAAAITDTVTGGGPIARLGARAITELLDAA